MRRPSTAMIRGRSGRGFGLDSRVTSDRRKDAPTRRGPYMFASCASGFYVSRPVWKLGFHENATCSPQGRMPTCLLDSHTAATHSANGKADIGKCRKASIAPTDNVILSLCGTTNPRGKISARALGLEPVANLLRRIRTAPFGLKDFHAVVP